jgi:tetratricopeptide (TPR) repeat protein
VYCLGRVYERARLFEQSEAQYRRVAHAPSPLRVEALLRLARRARRKGDQAEAVDLWTRAADDGDWRALRALAVHHEHRGHDPAAALAAVERALERLRVEAAPAGEKAVSELLRRRRRLLARLARRPH